MIYLGRSIKRFEDARLVIGDGVFIDDIKLPDMLHAVVVRSVHAHARIRSINVVDAIELDGVVEVLIGADLAGKLPDLPIRPMGDRSVDEFNPPEHPVLAQDKVCYVGQPVAVVVAKNSYLARDGAELVAVDYEPLTPVVNPVDAANEDVPVIHPHLGTNVAMRSVQEGGDIEKAFAQAAHIVRQKYQIPRLAPSSMETRGVIGNYDASSDLLTVWDSTQAPNQIKRYLAQMLGRPEESIRVVAPDVGGSFGIKDCMFSEDVLMPFLALRLQKPVKWVEDRQENLITYHGRGMSLDVEVAVDKKGVILGIRASILADIGAYFYFTTPFPLFNAARRITGPYDVPAVRVDLLGVITNKTPVAAYRGTGSPEAAFCIERTLDLIAKDLGLDPAEIRRSNYISKDAFPYKSCTGNMYDSGDYLLALDRALELVEYSAWQEKIKQRRPGDPYLGVGLATFIKSSGAGGEHRVESARVTIDSSGQIDVYTGVSPHGQGTETTFAQIAAETLGVDPSQVRVHHSDTAIYPHGIGTSASRGLIIGGSAVQLALKEAREKLAGFASKFFSCPAADIKFSDGEVFDLHHPDTKIPFEKLAAMESGLDFEHEYTLPQSPVSFGAHAVVVEVDQDTLALKILRYVGVHDCGQIINPMIVEGQIHGGIAQGIGQALIESIVYSEEGQPLTGSLMDYALPRSTMIPDLTLDTIDTISPTNPLGAKGIGSVSTVPSPAAIANAVMNAISPSGVRHIDAPYTPERLWRAIREHGTVDG
ncbi:MAG: xanthine dehydrogenase family protein molybdopterin-binding subunit [Dehalococcoidia bacterium]|nr:xanthine dehydrogenase family protein molybdopterin-binding subunit [Dehalococcoidia bacterium]